MPGAEDKVRIASWLDRDVLRPVATWLDAERLPYDEAAIRRRAIRASSIGEIDPYACAWMVMRTGSVLGWLWRFGVGVSSAWVEPDGKVDVFSYGGHDDWIKANIDYLVSMGAISREEATKSAVYIGAKLMKTGWVRYSGGSVVTSSPVSDAQVPAIEKLWRESGVPSNYKIDLMLMGDGVMASSTVGEILSKGLKAVMASSVKPSSVSEEVPLSPHQRKADAGGGTSGPFQSGDGQDIQTSYNESLQDGSTAKFDKAWDYLAQDWDPEVWWSRDLLQYLKQKFPGKKDVSGPETNVGGTPSANAPRPGFAAMVERLVKFSDLTDPSDTDPQHDQVEEESMATHLVDPNSHLYREQEGLGAPTKELKTRLGEITPNPNNPGLFMIDWRKYQCEVCGNIQPVSTNHLGPVLEYCHGCSWKPSAGPGQTIPALGPHTYRRFDYVGEIKDWDKDFEGQAKRSASLRGRWTERRSDKAVEEEIVQMEKGHMEPVEIKQELREEGVPQAMIDDTYENRDRNLFKTVEVRI